jgi:hypothetical protein
MLANSGCDARECGAGCHRSRLGAGESPVGIGRGRFDMLDMDWTIPVARWSYWSADAGAAPSLSFVEPIVRRRLSALSRMALHVAYECAAGYSAVRLVFASRHGELSRTSDILDCIAAGEPVSPTAFSLSVLNAMTGIFGISRRDTSAATAISAGAESLGYGLLEAHAQLSADSTTPVLLVYADEPAGARYGPIDDEVAPAALAILLDGTATAVHLRCNVTIASADCGSRSATQCDAVIQGLRTSEGAVWIGSGRRWFWTGSGGAKCSA